MKRPAARPAVRPKEPAAYSQGVSKKAWAADKEARKLGRVQIFNATRPHGMDGWTMDLKQYAAR